MYKLIAFIFLTSYLSASNAFISPEVLHSKLKNSNLVLLDVTDKATYDKAHIPGAINVNVSDFRYKEKTYQLMQPSDKIQTLARSLGINNDSEIVLYGHGKEKELLKSSYIALSLIINGAKNVSILDGGFSEWKFDYGTSSKKIPEIKTGNFVASFNKNVLVDLEYVRAHINKTPMIEARPLKFFTGEAQSGGVERLGHITGAMSSFWKDKFRQDETLFGKKELEKIYLKDHKLNPKEELIVYCTGGLEASMNWYITTQVLNFENVKVYDASMREWGNRYDTPMEK